MGDAPAPAANESMANVLQAYQQNLPGFLSTANANILPSEQARLNAAQTISPGYARLNAQLFDEIAPQLSQTGSNIARQEALNQAQTDAAVLAGPGADVVRQQNILQREIDPEYYAQRTNTSNNLSRLFDSIDLSGGLSGGETEAIRRGLAQEGQARGTSTSPSMTETVANATTYGAAANDRRNQARSQLTSALNTATGALPAMRSGTDAFQVATGRSSQPNSGNSQFTGVNQNLGQSTDAMANNVLNSATGLATQQNEINANRRDGLDRFNETWSSVIGSL